MNLQNTEHRTQNSGQTCQHVTANNRRILLFKCYYQRCFYCNEPDPTVI